ncbi:hypothetical protein HGRIS_012000 [Hohenbuehelia grisea]|uniref:Uncharacterized protein n=1 Tax=Hohenbuehelia grisea TaxID=104357 RepID=A0ABR3JWZ0_9AGAR
MSASNALQAFKDAETTFQVSITSAAVAAKKAETAFWKEKTQIDICCGTLFEDIDKLYSDEKQHHLRPVIAQQNRQNVIASWDISPQFDGQRDALVRAIPTCLHAIERIVSMRHRAANLKFEKKRKVAEKADAEMADVSRPGPSVQSMVDKAITAHLKKLNLSKAKTKATPSTQGSSKTSQTPRSQAKAGPKPKKPAAKARQTAKDDAKKKGKGKASTGKPNCKGKGRAT